ncbi:MAG TPA: hypothetical protein VGJ84_16115 [Polyangiaceae bacterium]|jgi:hypothetical protein
MMLPKSVFAVVCALPALACTTLGPMPATTGIAAAPMQRPSVGAQFGFIPGYYLSSAVQKNPKGSSFTQLALLLEPDRWIVPGLIAGARIVGSKDTGSYIEPGAGYRAFLDSDRRVAVGGVAFGTHSSHSKDYASYDATRMGAEALLDVRPTPWSKWFELHLLAGASFTGLWASGDYCLDVDGLYGVQCPNTNPLPVHARASGLYPALTGGLALDFARHLEKFFHGGSFAVLASAGTMPAVVGKEQKSAKIYGSVGATLSLAFGAELEKP